MLLEEIGHFIDAQVNTADTPGDEGALFAALVQGIQLDRDTLEAITREDDTTTLILDRQAIVVEKAAPYAEDNLDLFQLGLQEFLSALDNSINEVVYSKNLLR